MMSSKWPQNYFSLFSPKSLSAPTIQMKNVCGGGGGGGANKC